MRVKYLMTEDEKQTLRNSFAGKKVSQMSPAEREVYDEDSDLFHNALYGHVVGNQLIFEHSL